VTDVFPALALAFGEGDGGVMERPPRPPGEPILARRHWRALVGHGVLIATSVLAALFGAVVVLGLRGNEATTISFLALAFAQLWHVFNVGGRGRTLAESDIARNPWVWGALALCSALLAAAVFAPGLADVLQLHAPDARGWSLALGLSLVPLLAGQAWMVATRRRAGRAAS
jgi:Ca2+-transporting ATPase